MNKEKRSAISSYLETTPQSLWLFKNLAPKEYELELMRQEVFALGSEHYLPHVNESHQGWKQVVLRGISPNHNGHFTRYGYAHSDQVPWVWVEITKCFLPTVHRFILDRFSFLKLHRVVISALEPGGVIQEHSDTFPGVHCSFLVVLDWPEECYLKINDHSYDVENGSCAFINYTQSHKVMNQSSRGRIVISIMGKPKEDFSLINFFGDG